MTDYAVEVNNVSMRFNLARERVDNLKEYFIRKIQGNIKFDEFYALREISFKIEKGDAFAIVGSNGSGKSTMLKIISGIIQPTAGEVIKRGSIAPLIELGAGFDMELTAKENVFLNGAILGYSRNLIQEKYDEIIEFAELEEFADVPVKNFSSGMIARLGFSIATIVKPAILIVDEILSVGDQAFHKKCEIRMKQLMAGGTTVILVSHAAADIKKICKNAVWINKSKLMCIGSVDDVLKAYSNGRVKKNEESNVFGKMDYRYITYSMQLLPKYKIMMEKNKKDCQN